MIDIDKLRERVRRYALLEAADILDEMWTDQVSLRPKANYLYAGMDRAYRNAALRLRSTAVLHTEVGGDG